MIIPVREAPECLKHQSKDHVFFELYDDLLYGYASIRRRGVYADAHVEVERFSHNIAKQMKKDMVEFKGLLRSIGIKKLIAQKNAGDTVWPKFIKLLGFSEPEQIQISYMDI